MVSCAEFVCVVFWCSQLACIPRVCPLSAHLQNRVQVSGGGCLWLAVQHRQLPARQWWESLSLCHMLLKFSPTLVFVDVKAFGGLSHWLGCCGVSCPLHKPGHNLSVPWRRKSSVQQARITFVPEILGCECLGCGPLGPPRASRGPPDIPPTYAPSGRPETTSAHHPGLSGLWCCFPHACLSVCASALSVGSQTGSVKVPGGGT